MAKYIAFDIETVKPFPKGERWQEHRPLGIACAAAVSRSMDKPRVWHSSGDEGTIATQMSKEDLRGLVRDLAGAVERGYTILTWNGTGFDFDILAEESEMLAQCRSLARSHVDMMFHLFCAKGHPLALRTACIGNGTTAKTEEMDGAQAVQMWHEGARQKVIDYCGQDVQATLELAIATEKVGGLRWTSRAGYSQRLPLPQGWKSVDDALLFPEPDTSWMDSPISRSDFTAWLND